MLSVCDKSLSLVFTDGKTVHGSAYAEAPNKIPIAKKAMEELGWQPTRTLDQIVQDVVEYERRKQVKA